MRGHRQFLGQDQLQIVSQRICSTPQTSRFRYFATKASANQLLPTGFAASTLFPDCKLGTNADSRPSQSRSHYPDNSVNQPFANRFSTTLHFLLCIAAFHIVHTAQSQGSPPLNADPSVKYIGSQACVACHPNQHKSYLATSHSKTMERVDPSKETTTGSFRHALSGNDYEVFLRGDQLFHREIIRGSNDEVLATTENPILYTMGSGSHGKSYVYRKGEFFGQSPLSWYVESKKWAMSPGYDLPNHPGFSRKLSSECFFCHVGSIDRKEGNPNDFTILEETVGCERCHGPGELHAKKYRNRKPATSPQIELANSTEDTPDNTIVNPARLNRDLSEAICQQCHLQAAGKALRAGKDEWDFRPGTPLTDIRLDYQYRLGDDKMKIVGHVEQLHQSKCYQQAGTLTCITCHNPHDTPSRENMVAHYRSICLDCHDNDACGEPLPKRVSTAQNDCAKCHMPKLDTEIPHTAFHHHRIGIHDTASGTPEVAVGLSPILDISGLTPLERARCEALAKFQVGQEEPDNPNFKDYGLESAKALIQLKNSGKADADANTILALLARSQGQSAIAGDLATEVVAMEKRPTRAKVEALRLLAQLAYQGRKHADAAKLYRQVTQHQSEAYDYFQLGISEQNSGQTERAITALKMAVELAPNYVEAHRVLAAILGSQGKTDESNKHQQLALQHEQRMQRLWQSTLPE